MRSLSVCFILLLAFSVAAYPQQVERFEHLATADGLSQNSALSIFCDSKGFMWFGTMNGLNRYDGYNIKVYKVNERIENTLTHNRIDEIWEDSRQFIWVKTYDGYVHYFIPETEEFITFPDYLRSGPEKNSVFSYFHQLSDDEIWLGSTSSGAYRLLYDEQSGRYLPSRFQSVKNDQQTLSDNSVSFIYSEPDGTVWIGTDQGLNRLRKDRENKITEVERLFNDVKFTSVVQLEQTIYFGAEGAGVISYDVARNAFTRAGLLPADDYTVTVLQKTYDNKLLVGTARNGIFVANSKTGETDRQLSGKRIVKIYEDNNRRLWINTDEFGIYRYNPERKSIQKYRLSNSETILIDDERQYLFEDSRHNIWIGFHGGLAFFNKTEDQFEIYRNNPRNPASISSNIVYCVAEDKSGLLWVGTGKPKGGVDKIIMTNPAFRHLLPAKEIRDESENVIRSLFRDSNDHVWIATKGGKVYILSPENQAAFNISSALFKTVLQPDQNIYTIMEDRQGRIWMGSKGGGVYISRNTVKDGDAFYSSPEFSIHKHDPADPSSLSGNNVYSIIQDSRGQVWIGTYGGGLNLVERESLDQLICRRINTVNSSLSSDDVRHLYEDSQQRLWIATAFGLNLLEDTGDANFPFRKFLYNPADSASIGYNDIVSIFEDSRNRLWFATFGGGVSVLESLDATAGIFRRWTQRDGLANDATASILEDRRGRLWIGTEKGVSRYNPETGAFENLDRHSGLPVENFSENTACLSARGDLLYGSSHGLALIDPDEASQTGIAPNVVITNFQIFNKDIDYRNENSPIRQHIETLDKISLNRSQSSFSFEYAALSYFAPLKNQYAFKLENFDKTWNEVGSQRKATYTNLPPGKYTFQVKAASWDGTWNETPRSIEVTILPAWWETKAAFLGYFILFVIIFEIIRRSYLRYYRLQNDLKVEKRVNEIKLKFFTNISHEIRTPLTLILGPIADIKTLKNMPEKALTKIDIMERNGKRMLRLVNQLLDFRKIQKNKMKLRIRECDMNAFVYEIVENFIPLAEHRNISIEFEPDRSETKAWIDPEKFDAVIFNILSNAVKFTPPGKKIRVETDGSMDWIDIRISDEGPGIPKEKLGLLFHRFTDLGENHGEIYSSGIGLSLANEIVKLHQGSILVESAPGKGACFTIRMLKGRHHLEPETTTASLNGETTNHKKETIEYPATPQTPRTKHGHKILIVEDNHEIVNYLYDCLSPYYELQYATNGKEALLKLSQRQPDLIITDVMMPEMDGVEMTRQIKENLDVSHIPVIMLTARSTMEDQMLGIGSGAEAYILKPFNAQYLLAVVGNLIEQRTKIYQKFFKNKTEIAPENITITTKDEKFLEDVVKLIEENYQNPEFNVESLVASSYVSRTVFYNKIKGLTGLSPSDFLRQMRIKIAGKLLQESDYNISEIAYMTGFNNVKYFRQHFKKVFGVAPNEYRQNYNDMANS